MLKMVKLEDGEAPHEEVHMKRCISHSEDHRGDNKDDIRVHLATYILVWWV
jgi:hypothetical protein